MIALLNCTKWDVVPSSKATKSGRKLALPRYKSFRLSKRLKRPKTNLPSGFKLFRLSVGHLWRHKRLFGGLFAIYLVLSLIFVKSSSETLTDSEAEVIRLYQLVLFVLVSLAVIWSLRQTSVKNAKISLRDSLYKSMYPLIPFQLVSVVIALQLIPIAIASYFYQIVFVSELAATQIEQVLWAALIGCLFLLSFYMLASSIFGLFIVTLPDTYPMQALRSARELVRLRRWLIVRKLLFLGIALGVLAVLAMLPALFWAPDFVSWIAFVLGLLAVFVVHSYIYQLYKELLP